MAKTIFDMRPGVEPFPTDSILGIEEQVEAIHDACIDQAERAVIPCPRCGYPEKKSEDHRDFFWIKV